MEKVANSRPAFLKSIGIDKSKLSGVYSGAVEVGGQVMQLAVAHPYLMGEKHCAWRKILDLNFLFTVCTLGGI